jgi:hypothetical protein
MTLSEWGTGYGTGVSVYKTAIKLNSAQHARSVASRLDDAIDRSALKQAREGLGGRDMEEAAHLDLLGVQKSTLEV